MAFWPCSNMKQPFHFWRFWWFLGSPKATPHMNRWLITVYGIGSEKLRFEATRNISSWDPFIASACPSSCKSERIPMIHDDSFLGEILENMLERSSSISLLRLLYGAIVLFSLTLEDGLVHRCSRIRSERTWSGESKDPPKLVQVSFVCGQD